jgi:hypothetical protein
MSPGGCADRAGGECECRPTLSTRGGPQQVTFALAVMHRGKREVVQVHAF